MWPANVKLPEVRLVPGAGGKQTLTIDGVTIAETTAAKTALRTASASGANGISFSIALDSDGPIALVGNAGFLRTKYPSVRTTLLLRTWTEAPPVQTWVRKSPEEPFVQQLVPSAPELKAEQRVVVVGTGLSPPVGAPVVVKATDVNVVLAGSDEGQRHLKDAFADGSISGPKSQMLVYWARRYSRGYAGMPANIEVSADREVLTPALEHYLEDHGFPKTNAAQLATYILDTWFRTMADKAARLDVSGVKFVAKKPPEAKTFGELSQDEIRAMLKEAQEAAAPVLRADAERFLYVDDFAFSFYSLGYRLEGSAGLSTWLRLRYTSYPEDVIIDINLNDIHDTTSMSDTEANFQRDNATTGNGGRLFPRDLNPKTTPRLVEAKKRALEVMGTYNFGFVIQSFLATEQFILPMSGAAIVRGTGDVIPGMNLRWTTPKTVQPSTTIEPPIESVTQEYMDEQGWTTQISRPVDGPEVRHHGRS